MTGSTLKQSLRPALETWATLITDGPENAGADFSETNRTRRCRTRFDAFLDSPNPDTFRALWSAETLAGYWTPNAAVLLAADDAINSLHSVFSDMDATAEFNPAWVDRVAGTGQQWGLYELFYRTQGGHNPIISIEAKRALRNLGYTVEGGPNTVATAITRFKDEYTDRVGHASAGTPYELPIYAEIDEFFRLIETADRDLIQTQLTGPYAPLFRPLIGHQLHTDTADTLQWTGVDALIEDHVDARDSGAYDDLETSHWGGTHIESWKWQFKDYFTETIRAEFELTNLSADDVPRFFDAIEHPEAEFDAVSNVPAKMMGGQFHRLTWNDIVKYCRESPEEAAPVLSDLFNDELPIVDRLNEFYEFFHHLTVREENDRSPGSLLRAATALLMYAFPNRHITFQYERMNRFFLTYSTADGLDTGFNARQYKEVALACRTLLDKIEATTGEASMIDVQTLIYVADDA